MQPIPLSVTVLAEQNRKTILDGIEKSAPLTALFLIVSLSLVLPILANIEQIAAQQRI